MVDEVLSSPHHLGRRNAQLAACTFPSHDLLGIAEQYVSTQKRKFYRVPSAIYGSVIGPVLLVFTQSPEVLENNTLLRLLEEVLLAEDHAVPCEALVCELTSTLGTLETTRVPGSFQDLEDKAIQDQLVAATALRYTCWNTTNILSSEHLSYLDEGIKDQVVTATAVRYTCWNTTNILSSEHSRRRDQGSAIGSPALRYTCCNTTKILSSEYRSKFIQDLEDEAIQDHLVAATALRYTCCNTTNILSSEYRSKFIQDLEDEAIQDQLVAATALRYTCWNTTNIFRQNIAVTSSRSLRMKRSRISSWQLPDFGILAGKNKHP
ncbi:hypothetical protein J6590_098451 [Homalodisca vitripennis]|nr:hypothetical protein J6590_098451 [Homalodisca vitripennis]